MDELSIEWYKQAWKNDYPYHVTWKGVPVLQYPQDLIGLQTIIFRSKPSVIIECGVAHGGLTRFIADIHDDVIIAIEKTFLPGVKRECDNLCYETGNFVETIERSSTDDETIEEVKAHLVDGDKVMVILDSDHTHEHVLKELQLYSQFVTPGCYLIVQDTIIEYMPPDYCDGKSYGKGNNPYTAVQEFMKGNDRFTVDFEIEDRLGITCAPGGWLKCEKGV